MCCYLWLHTVPPIVGLLPKTLFQMSKPDNNPLRFKVAPHIVEDLGLNLYTSLPRVLAEYVANAYDADSESVKISLDMSQISQGRNILKRKYDLEKAQMDSTEITALDKQTLPENVQIIIEDTGIGMSREDLDKKFLLAGRRRRVVEPACNGRTPGKNRLIMGRKGLGKLAGFGVAKNIQVTTRKEGERAIQISLDFDDLVEKSDTYTIDIPESEPEDNGGIPISGTRIILSKLLYGPTKSKLLTIKNELRDSFYAIHPEDFVIEIANETLNPEPPAFAFAWPDPDSVPLEDLVDKTIRINDEEVEDGNEEYKVDAASSEPSSEEISFRYRLRFMEERRALEASKRGVRVYSNHRLAAMPSLLDADTNMHGFRMVDYLDGIVEADFIDAQDTDYIATDRQSLRWDTPLLSPVRKFLSKEIKEACKAYQKKRDEESEKVVKDDEFTKDLIAAMDATPKEKDLAYRIAAALRSALKKGTDDPVYKEHLPGLLQALGHGAVLSAISKLADSALPDLTEVVKELLRLTKDEFDQFAKIVKGRIDGINALRKIVTDAKFGMARNEEKIQVLMEKCPWLIDPMYGQFLIAADISMNSVFKEITSIIHFDGEVSRKAARTEPDLVFLIGSEKMRKLVIVELKASNIVLNDDHLRKLEQRMALAEKWFDNRATKHTNNQFQVHGHLVGTINWDSDTREVTLLQSRMKKAGPECMWKVNDYTEILENAEAAHQEWLDAAQKTEQDHEM